MKDIDLGQLITSLRRRTETATSGPRPYRDWKVLVLVLMAALVLITGVHYHLFLNIQALGSLDEVATTTPLTINTKQLTETVDILREQTSDALN